MPSSSDPRSRGLQMAFDLFDAAESLMRQNLRRRYPHADEAEIEKRIVDWLRDRPGAPDGDAPGTLRAWVDIE